MMLNSLSISNFQWKKCFFYVKFAQQINTYFELIDSFSHKYLSHEGQHAKIINYEPMNNYYQWKFVPTPIICSCIC